MKLKAKTMKKNGIQPQRNDSFGERCVLVTNGNLASMLALAGWLKVHGDKVIKIHVTYKLPSSKNNVSGALDLWRRSGVGYLWMKLLLNKILPMQLRFIGSSASVSDYVASLGHEIPVEPVDNVNTPQFLEKLKDLEPKCLVSFSATQRFSKEMIRTFPNGAVNVHYGLLPRYAGLSPYFWHLHFGEEKFGVTLHRIEEQLDAGKIIKQVEKPTPVSKDALDLLLDMAEQVSPMLNGLFNGEYCLDEAVPQDLANRSYFKHPSRSQLTTFKKNGCTLTSKASISRLRGLAKALDK